MSKVNIDIPSASVDRLNAAQAVSILSGSLRNVQGAESQDLEALIREKIRKLLDTI